MMKWIYLAILAPLFLAGCNGEKDTDYYRKHHDELITEYTDCLLHDQFHSPTNTKCSYVRDASKYEKDSPDIQEGIKNAQLEKSKQTEERIKKATESFMNGLNNADKK